MAPYIDGWDATAEAANKSSDNSKGMFLRLENDGDRAVVVLVGKPLGREVVWVDGSGYVDFDPKKHKEDDKTLKVKVNAYVFKRGVKVGKDQVDWKDIGKVQIFECGAKLWKDVIKARDKYGIGDTAFEIERRGEAKSTKTTYAFVFEKKLSQDEMKHIAAQELHDLAKDDEEGGTSFENYDKKDKEKAAAANGNGNGGTASAPAASGEIDPKVASEIGQKLKALPNPKEAADKLTTKFGVQRIRDIKKSDEAAAMAYVNELCAPPPAPPPAAPPAEVDPFA